MIGLVLLVVVVVIVLAMLVFGTTQRGHAIQPAGIDPLAAQLRRWATDGLLTEEQAAAILAAEQARVQPPAAAPTRPVSVTVELLGYLGGILAIIGASLLAARFWRDLGISTRLTLLGLVAVALWAAGAVVHEHANPALWRLRGVLWLLSSAAVAFFAGLFCADVLDLGGEAVAMVTGFATAAHAGALWLGRPRPLQQLACLAGVVVTVGGGVGVVGGTQTVIGLTMWVVGVGWVLLAWYKLLPPTGVALLAGAVVALSGAQAMAIDSRAAGLLLGLASAVGLLLVGMAARRLALAGVGIAGVVVFLPTKVVHFFAGTVGVPVLILLSGVALLAVTLVILRVRLPWAHAPAPMPSDPPPKERTSPSDSTAGPDAA
jgi:hypothetical protein